MKSLVELADDYIKNKGGDGCLSLRIPQMLIRASKLQTLETKYFEKTFRAMSTKRRIDGNDTLPYGYVRH